MGFKTPRQGQPHILEPLLCDLNNITDPEADLRLSRTEFLLLPPEEIMQSGKSYCLLRKGENLADVLNRKGIIELKVSGVQPQYDYAFRMSQLLRAIQECNPCITGLGLHTKNDSNKVQYVQLPDQLMSKALEVGKH
jgi:hypothetical protein